MSSTPRTYRIRALALFGGVALFVAACSSSGASTAPSLAAASTTPSSAAGSAGDLTVAAATGTVGTFLTGKDGKTLYTFAADSANKTACVDACATKWPPFVVDGGAAVKAGDGVTGTLATFARPDGSMQVTYNGIPLYYYGGDGKAGDTTGQGFADKWFVASPTGTLGSPAPSSSGRAY